MVLVTLQDMIIEEQRAEIKRLNSELTTAKAMLHRLSKYVSDEVLAQIALEMMPKPKEEKKSFWED